MSRFRMFVLSLWVTCVCVGLVDGEEAVEEASAEPHSENPVVFGGVEVCGPIYEAFLFLGPKDENGKLDPHQIEPWPHPSGLFRATFSPPEGVTIEFGGVEATVVHLGDFKGQTQTVIATWDLGTEGGKAVWEAMNSALLGTHGEPADENDGAVEWREPRLRAKIDLDPETGEVTLSYHCLPNEDEFWARVESVPIPEEPTEAEASEGFQPPEQVLGRPLLYFLAMNGEPTVGPYWRGENTVGLYYEDFDFMGIPCRLWLWFVDGESVYKGYEFAPPFGPSRAVEAFGGFSAGLSSWYGKPFLHIGGEEFDRIKDHWLNGVEETSLSLELADDPPWLSLEVTHREKIREIGGDLRPGGKPIPRYVPPPEESGKTRRQLVGGNARG